MTCRAEELPLVSVVVISKDRHAELERAVASLLKLDYPRERYELVIVEEGDEPRPLSGVEYVFLPRRDLGLGYARNTGVRHARGDLVAFTDDDCLVDPRWLREIVARFTDPEVQGVAGATFAQESGVIGMSEDVLGFPGGGHRRYHQAGGRDMETRLLSGCNMTYRRQVFDEISFKEDGYGRLGADDYLLAVTVAAQGKCLYVPAAVVYHKPRASLRRIISWFMRRKVNELLFAEREEGRKNLAFLFRHPGQVVTYRVLAATAAVAAGGPAGLEAVLLAVCAWYAFIFVRSYPVTRYFHSRALPFVVPVVRFCMDLGVLRAEWRYVFRGHVRLGSTLSEYRR